MTYSVYILECNDGTLYTGVSNDVEKRFAAHLVGEGAKYTRARGAKRIVYTEQCGTRGEAQQREAAIKKMTRSEKQSLIAEA